jgi:hypothetical protein
MGKPISRRGDLFTKGAGKGRNDARCCYISMALHGTGMCRKQMGPSATDLTGPTPAQLL